MKINLSLTILLSFFGLSIFSQSAAIKSEEFSLKCSGEVNSKSVDLKWLATVSPIVDEQDLLDPDHKEIQKILAQKANLKTANRLSSNQCTESGISSLSPTVGANWQGNLNNGSSPLDNNIAISNGGVIVSVSNCIIEIDNSAGSLLYYNDLVSFINDNTITSVCDPVVVYDQLADRFIFFCQVSPLNSATSKLLIFFSKTNNPATGGWWYYKLTGNPINDNSAFDYPKLAISNNELYITGNLYFDGGSYNQSVIYQIEKFNGYSGASINWQFWKNISGSPFTLLPVSNGMGTSYGPGCYLVATSSAGSSTIKLYHLTDDMAATNETLTYNSVSTNAYSPVNPAAQFGTSNTLDVASCRSLSGFYLNGIIHFVFHSDFNATGYNGINYNRLDISSLTNVSSTFGASGFDYSYPSIASAAKVSTDKSVVIGFGRSASTIYPEIRAIYCDDNMVWSNSTSVKAGVNWVGYSAALPNERWGDYTGCAKKYNSNPPEIWMNGMFGNSVNKWETWIAQILPDPAVGIDEIKPENKNISLYPNPIVENFSLAFDANGDKIEIKVIDLLGKEIITLYNGIPSVGKNIFNFNKANLPSGTYFIEIKSNSKKIKNEKIVVN